MPDALEEAFTRHRAELLGTLYYVLGNVDDARDAFQEAFVKCWRRRDDVERVENLKAWIFRVAWNTGRDFRRNAWRRKREPHAGDENMLMSTECEPEAAVEKDEQLACLRKALAALPEEQQAVFLLRQNGEMTYEQIAETLGAPLGTVKTRMRLAIGRLREALAPAN